MTSLLLPLRRRCTGFVLALALLLGMASSALALNLTVTSAADSGPGTLRQAISASAPGGTIDFDPTLNGQTITLTSGQLGIARDLTINGPGWGKLTISGNDQTRIFEITSGHTVNISGLTLSHGKVQGADGAKRGEDCQDVVFDGVVVGHHLVLIPATAGLPGRGGAILNAGQLTMSYCRLENNSAVGGAGGSAGYFFSYCSNPVLGTFISNGDSGAGGNGEGGAIHNSGTLVLTACTFENNTANGGLVGYTSDNNVLYPGSNTRCGDGGGGLGGAVANSGDLTVQECTFHQNAARGHDPSAIGPTSGQITTVEANIGGNGGVGYGGAIFSSAATVVKNSTFAENHAVGGLGGLSRLADLGFVEQPGNGGDGAGGGIKTDIAPESSSVCTIWYCTFSGNTTQGGPGGFVDFDSSVVGNPGGAYGGGVHARYDNTTVMWSSIVAGNSGMHPDVSSAITSYGFNLIGAINGSSGWTADDLTGYIDNNGTDFSLDPLLGPLQDNGGPTKTILPEQGSAAIDHGGGGYTPTTDQRGLARVVDLAKYPNAAGGSDIGAVEVAGYNGTPRIWVNTNGGNWSVTNNWSGGVPPGSNDVAVITLNGNYTVTLDVSPTIAGLVLGATVGTNKQILATGGQTLSLNGSSIVNAQGVMNHSGGTLGGSGDLAVQGAMNWNSGTINRSGGLSIGSSGTLNITGAGNNHDLPNTAVTNNGKVVWSGGTVRGGSTTIVNKGLWDAQGDVPISQAFSGQVTVDNTGTFKKSAGSGALALGANVFMKNSGLVDVQAGRMDFNGGGTNDAGTFNAGTNGAVNFNTSFTFNHGTKLLGAGSKQFVAGTFTLNGTITTTNLTHTGGTLTGSPTLDGEFYWNSGAVWGGAGAVTIAPTGKLILVGSVRHDLAGRILTNNGTVTWNDGNILGQNGTAIYNNGLWEAQSDNRFYYDGQGAAPAFYNAGTFRKTGGLGTTYFYNDFGVGFAFNNAGMLDVQSGTVSLLGGGVNIGTGVFNTTNGATLSFNSDYSFNSGTRFTGNGTNLLAAGTFTLSGNISFTKLMQTGGTLAGTNVLNGLFVLSTAGWNTVGSTTISNGSTLSIIGQANPNLSGRILTNNGMVTWNGGNISGENGTAIYNNGLWEAQSDNNLNYNGNGVGPAFYNAGTFRKSGGLGTTLFNNNFGVGFAFNNTGTLDVQCGTVSLTTPRSLTGGKINIGMSNATNYGKVLLGSAAGLSGMLTANLIGSYVPSPGTAFPIISYGSLSGSFGSFNLPANNAWQTNYGSTTFTLTAQSVLSYPPVQLQSPQISNSTFMFTMQTVSNLNYTVLYNDNLATTNWQPYTNFSGDGLLRKISITRTNTQRFFRISQP